MIWFLIYCVSMVWFCFFMMYRVRQVSKALRIHYSIAKSIVDEKIKDGEVSDLSSVERHYDCIWHYHKMVWHFWIWDLRYMVNDVESFCDIYGEDPGEMKLW